MKPKRLLIGIIPSAMIVSILFLSFGMQDNDADGVLDNNDNCIDVMNPTQEDFDQDSFGD